MRRMKLIGLADGVLLIHNIFKNYDVNKQFRRSHTNIAIPPYRLAYDAYGSCNFLDFYNSGQQFAIKLDEIIRKYTNKRLTICEWGCGPARILPHFLTIDNGIEELIGTDYNEETINWCKEKYPSINFICNKLTPPWNFLLIPLMFYFASLSSRTYQKLNIMPGVMKLSGC